MVFSLEIFASLFQMTSQAHSRGVRGVQNFSRSEGLRQISSSGAASSPQSSQLSLSEKPWKKHHNKGKKEKLRRIYNELDN